MIDHIVIKVRDVGRSRAFYTAALRPLGYTTIREFQDYVGFGAGGKADVWIAPGAPAAGPLHIALLSPDRRTVDAFHAAALKAGGRDNGAPGLRTLYHPHYYGAFVLDPDGNNIEAVCHDPKG